jgi:hypothetical protein
VRVLPKPSSSLSIAVINVEDRAPAFVQRLIRTRSAEGNSRNQHPAARVQVTELLNDGTYWDVNLGSLVTISFSTTLGAFRGADLH